MFKTHMAFGFLISLIFINIFSTPLPWLFVILATLASILPDIDTPKSKISRKIPLLPSLISFFVKHRGIFHSIWIPLIIFIILHFFNLTYLGLAIIVGYTSHLISDGFTKEGINFLHPFSKLHLSGFIKTGSLLEIIFFIAFIILDIYYLVITVL